MNLNFSINTLKDKKHSIEHTLEGLILLESAGEKLSVGYKEKLQNLVEDLTIAIKLLENRQD